MLLVLLVLLGAPLIFIFDVMVGRVGVGVGVGLLA